MGLIKMRLLTFFFFQVDMYYLVKIDKFPNQNIKISKYNSQAISTCYHNSQNMRISSGRQLNQKKEMNEDRIAAPPFPLPLPFPLHKMSPWTISAINDQTIVPQNNWPLIITPKQLSPRKLSLDNKSRINDFHVIAQIIFLLFW